MQGSHGKSTHEEAISRWKEGEAAWLDDGQVSFMAQLTMELLIHSQLLYREIEQRMLSAGTKLTMTDARVLTHLAFAERDTLASISSRLSIPKTTLHYAMRKMERQRLIQRCEGQIRVDQPSFSLTTKGEEHLIAVTRIVFHPEQGNPTYDLIGGSYEPMVASAMAMRAIARFRFGTEHAANITSEAERVIDLVKRTPK